MKKFASFVLSVLLALTFCIPAAAAEDYGVIYDETGQLGSEPLRYAGEVTLPALTERYGVDLWVDILTESDYDTVLDAAEGIYEEYEYGTGSKRQPSCAYHRRTRIYPHDCPSNGKLS